METSNLIGSAVVIITASAAAPMVIDCFLPWASNKKPKRSLPSNLLVLLNIAVYIFWYFKVVSLDSNQQLLLSLPLVISLILEPVLLWLKRFELLQNIIKLNVVLFIPYLLMISQFDPLLSLVLVHGLIQSVLYFPTFALLKAANGKTPFSFEISSDMFTDATFKNSSQYKKLKKAGMTKVTPGLLAMTIIKYGGVMFLLWLYSRIV